MRNLLGTCSRDKVGSVRLWPEGVRACGHDSGVCAHGVLSKRVKLLWDRWWNREGGQDLLESEGRSSCADNGWSIILRLLQCSVVQLGLVKSSVLREECGAYLCEGCRHLVDKGWSIILQLLGAVLFYMVKACSSDLFAVKVYGRALWCAGVCVLVW